MCVCVCALRVCLWFFLLSVWSFFNPISEVDFAALLLSCWNSRVDSSFSRACLLAFIFIPVFVVLFIVVLRFASRLFLSVFGFQKEKKKLPRNFYCVGVVSLCFLVLLVFVICAVCLRSFKEKEEEESEVFLCLCSLWRQNYSRFRRIFLLLHRWKIDFVRRV